VTVSARAAAAAYRLGFESVRLGIHRASPPAHIAPTGGLAVCVVAAGSVAVGPVAGEEQVDDAVGDVVVEVVEVAGDQDERREELEEGVLERDVRSEVAFGDAAP